MEFIEMKESDIKDLQRMASKIWMENYQEMISLEQIEYMLEKMYHSDIIQDQMRLGHYWFWIEEESVKAGYLHFYPREEKMFLSKFYLDKSFHGTTLAQKSLNLLKDKCKKEGVHALILTVNRNNHRALAFYKKSGFQKIGEEIFDIGHGFVMDDFLMEIHF